MTVSIRSSPAAAVIAAILVLAPLPSHWRARNVATLSLIAWFFVMNLIYGVNALVWARNSAPRIVVWCDITTKLSIGASTAIPAAAMCICKYLEQAASGRMVRLTHADHRKRRIFEFAMCWAVPTILMALHYIVQGHRFDVVEAIGCQPATYFSIPAIFIVWVPPLALSVATLLYASLALYHFFRQRINFSMHLSNSGTSLSTNRYLRLMAMSVTEICWGTSLNALALYYNVAPGLRPWTNWADVHSNFGRIASYRLFELPKAYLNQMFLIWWAMPVSAYIFFLFFAFGEESIKDYKKVFRWVKGCCMKVWPKKKVDSSRLPDKCVYNSIWILQRIDVLS
ncbi:fungal pheromone STE3G-protein-coupled receptor [Panus rudis PR-1116 ss-1]|nr:fungal pheromone STE3G-protein-coupled receptor [Panus rudis PR-1116 ss-1]